MCGACYQVHIGKLKAYGKFDPTYVDATATREHLAELRAAGMGYLSIATQAGLPRKTVAELHHRAKVHRDIEKLILGVDPPSGFDSFVDHALVPAIGTARRLQALTAIGYTMEDLVPYCDIHPDMLRRIRHGSQATIAAKTGRVIDGIFGELQLTRGSSTKAFRYAERRGWALPFAWDEETIDDPDAQPNLGDKNKSDWFAEYEEMREWGLTDYQIAERMSLSVDALKVRLRRAGRIGHPAEAA
jgi:hypothetical protein